MPWFDWKCCGDESLQQDVSTISKAGTLQNDAMEPASAAPEAFSTNSNGASQTQNDRFEVEVNNAKGDEMGLVFHHSDKYLLVASVDAGPIQEWNGRQENDAMRIRAMDRVAMVSGLTGSKAELKDMLMQKGDMKLLMEHSRLLGVMLAKDGDALGIKLSTWPGAADAMITAITSGIITEFNKRAPLEKQIKVHDIIVKFNDRITPGEEIIEMCEQLQKFKLTVRTYAAS
mmetsp:Transcript_103432/g.183754  ORF Transcript_103432/g.183754 Transcript_103432/m.183754 type:complete len:230 (-) Transcript_103432:25-714(-)